MNVSSVVERVQRRTALRWWRPRRIRTALVPRSMALGPRAIAAITASADAPVPCRIVSVYGERILPRLVDRACGTAELRAWREQVTAGLFGTVVEIGFGSGLNVAAYPDDVELVYAVEPSEVARRLAEPRIAAGSVTVEHIGLDGQRIPLADDSCDGALSTFTLCTIPDVDAALAELRRVVRPGGRLHFLEHGRSPDPGIAKWQTRIEPVQKRLAGGCHLTRDPAELVRHAGFELEQVSSRYGRGPKPWTWYTEGVARNP